MAEATDDYAEGANSPAWCCELMAIDLGGLAAMFEHRAAEFENLAWRDAMRGLAESATYKGGIAYAYNQAAQLARQLIEQGGQS